MWRTMTRARNLLLAVGGGAAIAAAALLAALVSGTAQAQDVNSEVLFHADHTTHPWGIWSDGLSFWIGDELQISHQLHDHSGDQSHLDVYRGPGRGFNVGNRALGIWSDGWTMYVADDRDNVIYAYDLASSARVPAKDIAVVPASDEVTGIWGDPVNRIMYTSDRYDDKVYVYDMDTGDHLYDRDFDLWPHDNHNAEGIWSDGRTLWVADSADDHMYAYVLDTGARIKGHEFSLASGNDHARGVWGNEQWMYVVDDHPESFHNAFTSKSRHVYAYEYSTLVNYETFHPETVRPKDAWYADDMKWISDASSGALHAYAYSNRRLPSRDFDTAAAGNARPAGMWSDGSHLWVIDREDQKVYAYDWSTRAHVPSRDIDGLVARNPHDLWSDGTTVWVGSQSTGTVHAYDLASGDRRPGSDVALEGVSRVDGLWSNGAIVWATSDGDSEAARAFVLTTGARQPGWDVALDAANKNPMGLWGTEDGSILHTVNNGSPLKEFAYNPRVFAAPEGLDPRDGRTSDIGAGYSILWVSDWIKDKLFAYDMQWNRRPDMDMAGLAAAGNNDPNGVWSDGDTVWVADAIDDVVRAYAAGPRQLRKPALDIDLDAANADPVGMWSDGATLWVADSGDKKAYAYDLHDQQRRPAHDVVFSDNGAVFGIWGNGEVFWTSDADTKTLVAYSSTGARLAGLDVVLAPGNYNPRGMWSDGETMWVLQAHAPEVYPYRMPASATLTLSPSRINEEGGKQGVIATVTVGSSDGAYKVACGPHVGCVVGLAAALSVTVDHDTTDAGDFNPTTIERGSRRGSKWSSAMIFEPADDDHNEGPEYLRVTATVSGTVGEDLVASTMLVLHDNDPDGATPTTTTTTVPATTTTTVPVQATTTTTVPAQVTTTTTTTTTVPVQVTTTTVPAQLSMGAVTLASSASGQIQASWPAAAGASSYSVEYRTFGAQYQSVDRNDAAATSETITSLDPYSEYQIRVTARHSGGADAATAIAHARPRTVSSTAAPALGAGQGYATGRSFTWSPLVGLDGNTVTGYTIQWTDDTTGPWRSLDTGTATGCRPNMSTSDCYFDYAQTQQLITSGTTYSFRLIAHAGQLESLPSPTTTARLDYGGL